MCVKLRGSKIGPGTIIPVYQKTGRSSSIWGFNDGEQYNARSEKIGSTYSSYTRGYIDMESFWEQQVEFVHKNNVNFHLAVILNNNNEFAILTREANTTVGTYHHRMPVVLNPMEQEKYLNGEFHSGLYLPETLIIIKQAA